VYVKQPPSFKSKEFPDYVYNLQERLLKFWLEHGHTRVKIDKTLFLKNNGKDLLVVQVYIGDIIFGSITIEMTHDFSKIMSCEFKMSMMGELTFILVLYIQQSLSRILIHQ